MRCLPIATLLLTLLALPAQAQSDKELMQLRAVNLAATGQASDRVR